MSVKKKKLSLSNYLKEANGFKRNALRAIPKSGIAGAASLAALSLLPVDVHAQANVSPLDNCSYTATYPVNPYYFGIPVTSFNSQGPGPFSFDFSPYADVIGFSRALSAYSIYSVIRIRNLYAPSNLYVSSLTVVSHPTYGPVWQPIMPGSSFPPTTNGGAVTFTVGSINPTNFRPRMVITPYGSFGTPAVGFAVFTVDLTNGDLLSYSHFPGVTNISDLTFDTNCPWTGFGTNKICCITAQPNLLPVELIQFKAQAKNDAVELHWITASELNNAGFEIERSEDGEHFVSIAFVEGQGTIEHEHSYQYSDNHVRKGKDYYYRLKQIDFDGSFEYSSVNHIKLRHVRTPTSIFPNPAKDRITLRYFSTGNANLSVQVFNQVGNTLISEEAQVHEGSNDLPIDVSHLGSGMYYAKISEGSNAEYVSFTID